VIVDAPTPTAVAFPPSSIVIALVLLDVHVTVVGVVDEHDRRAECCPHERAQGSKRGATPRFLHMWLERAT
jgi:hypothetical protein